MPGSFVSDLVKAAVIDLLFKRPIQLQFGRDATGKIDFRASINPSSGGNQQPVVYVQQQPPYGYPMAYPPGFQPPYQVAQPPAPPPASSGAPSQPEPRRQMEFDLNIPSFVRR